jgi:hypothetical protein
MNDSEIRARLETIAAAITGKDDPTPGEVAAVAAATIDLLTMALADLHAVALALASPRP